MEKGGRVGDVTPENFKQQLVSKCQILLFFYPPTTLITKHEEGGVTKY